MKKEEQILKLAVKKQLRTEPMKFTWDFRVSMNQQMERSRKGYIEIYIVIDNHPILVQTGKDIPRDVMWYFNYDGEDCFENGQKISYHLYLPSNLVLDNVPLYTTTNEERRRLKLIGIMNKFNI